MKTKLEKQKLYWEIYRQSHNNAAALLTEARLLFENGHYARAYFLAYTALEEISKSQHAADVYTGYSNEVDFDRSFAKHNLKIMRVGWAYYEAKDHPTSWIGPDLDDVEHIVVEEPLWKKRQDSMYVGLLDSKVITPKSSITKKDARGIIHILETALEQIIQMTEYWGHQIGTKGFMK